MCVCVCVCGGDGPEFTDASGLTDGELFTLVSSWPNLCLQGEKGDLRWTPLAPCKTQVREWRREKRGWGFFCILPPPPPPPQVPNVVAIVGTWVEIGHRDECI